MTHTPRRNARFVFFLVLSLVGLITAWVFNALGVMQQESYLEAWFQTPFDWVLSLNLLIVAVAGSAFMIFEARKLGMKRVWLYIVLSGVTAFAFTFPLFLAMREGKLQQLEAATNQS
jgi:uncharacterized membrane protein